MKYAYILLSLVLFSGTSTLIAQEDNVNFDDVKVIKEYSAQLGDFDKINIEPILPVFDLSSRKYKYSVRAIPMKLKYEKPKIRPLALPEPKPIHLNKYLVKLGYGYPKFLNAELSVGYKSGNMNSNIDLSHLSIDNTLKIKDQKNSITKLDFNFFDRKNEMDLEYGLNGSIDVRYYNLYAVNDFSFDSLIQTKRRLNIGDFSAIIKKEELISNLNNKTEFNYQFIQLNTGKILENIFTIKNTSEYNFNENTSLNLPVTAQTLIGTKTFALQANPFIQYSTRLFNIRAGGDMGKTQDLDFIYPYAEISSNLFDNFIEIFASVDNQIFNNTDYIKSQINPFMNFDKDSIATSVYNNYTLGVRNSLEGAKLEFIVTYQKIKNKLFFAPNFFDDRIFNTIYDGGKNIKLQVNLAYKILPQLEITGNVTNNIYTMDNIAKPWYNPALTANFTTKTELLSKKLFIQGELFFASQSWYQDYYRNKKKLPSLFDISSKTGYKFHKSSSIFVEVNNIFAQNYQKWYQYPSYGLNFLAGMELRF